MNNLNALFSVNNQSALLTLLGVLIAFVVLLTILGIIFIIALRKRRPIVKVIMAPEAKKHEEEEAALKEATDSLPAYRPEYVPEYQPEVQAEHQLEEAIAAPVEDSVEPEVQSEPVEEESKQEPEHVEEELEQTSQVAVAEQKPVENTVTPPVKVIDKQVDEGYLVPVYMITAYENVYYSFSPYEICSQPHEKYSAIRNNIQSYERVRERTNNKREGNKREGYRIARFASHGREETRPISPISPISPIKSKNGIRIATVKKKSI